MSAKNCIQRAIRVIMALLMAVMVVIACWQVFSRYVLNNPSVVTEELLRFLLIFLGMIGSVYSFGSGEHLAFSLVHDKVRRRTARGGTGMDIFIRTVNIVFALLVLVFGGWLQVKNNLNQISPVLTWTMGYVYLMLPLAGVLIIVLEVINIWSIATGGKEKRA